MRYDRRLWMQSVIAAASGAVASQALAGPFGRRGGYVASNTPDPGREPRVLLVTGGDSKNSQAVIERLEAADGAFAELKERGWRIGAGRDQHIQLIEAAKWERGVEYYEIQEFPWVAGFEEERVVRTFTHGCSTPLDMWTFYWLLTGDNYRPEEPIPEEVTVASTGNYPLRGGHWTVEHDMYPILEVVLTHLRGPNHDEQFPSEWQIEAWSYEELRSLHDDIHENGEPKPLLSEAAAEA